IYMTGNFSTKVDSNTVSRPTRTTVSTFNGIYMTGLSTLVNITRNTITNPFGGAPTSTSLFNGIFLTGVDALSGIENKIINNQVYNVTGAGEANGINNTSSDNVLIQHNTILMDGAGGSLITRGFYQTTLAGGVTFDNNIVAITRAGSGAKYAIYYGTITSDIASNRNDFYLNSPTGNEFVGFYTTPQATLANWQTASGDDANSVISNPFFANAAGGDLHPTNAGIDNLGAPLGVLIDITGAARSTTTPDIGAYEFTPGNCSAPPVAGIAEVNPSVVCANTLVQFSLSGNSTGLGQLYQWQFSTTIGGTYTNIGTAAANSGFSTTATTTLYYRAAVTCSGNTAFSTPVLLTVNPALPAGTYTINSTLPTGGTNYTSFAAAGQALSCGIAGPVVFNVAAGTGPYNEQFILGAVNGTSAVNTITFNGNGNTIAFSSNDNLDRAVIKLRDADHIIFDSLVINATGAGTYGFGVHLINNADSNTFNRCTVITSTTSTSTNFAGMVISSSESSATTTGATSLCDGNTFSNNEVTGGYYGITVVGSTTAVINNNKVTGNKVKDFYFYGIYTAGTTNTLVEGNDISRPDRTTVSTHYGVYSTGVQQGLRISKNRIHAPFAGNTASTSIFYGIYSTGTDADPATPTVVSNNLVYDVKSSGTQYGIYNTSTSSANYYHNTISLDDASNTATSLSYGFYQTTLSDNINLKNNIFNITRAGTGNKFALYFATATSTIVSDYNDLYVTGTNAFTGYNGTNQATLLAWQANASQDANSVAFQPIFSSIATGNLSPLNPVIDNKGTPVGIATDILNAVRSTTTPDLGAYEFTIPPCTAPPAAGGAIAIPNSGICIGFPIDLSLSGYNIGAGQTFQWQYSTAVGGPWLPLGGPRIFPDTTILASATLYYRAAVTCSGNTSFSTPVLVTLNPAFLAGTYTINSTIPSSATNFTSFATAVAALECGITGPVFFDVAPNTYNEQIRMHNVAGTSPTVRVTFRSANGNPASVILTNNAASAAANYTLQLDSASYITYRSMTINATNTTNGRVVELANTASADSIVNCVINAPVTTGTVNTSAGIFTDLLKGSANVFKGNTVNNGNIGINLEGTSTANLTYDNVIDSNTVNGSYYYGMYIGNTGRTKVNKNTVNVTMPRNTTNYGMYSISSDSAYQYTANKILVSGMTATTTYGMYFSGCDGRENNLGRIAGNTITAVTGNTGTLYGLYQTASTNNNTVNNVISTATTGATSYASYYTGGGGVRFQNNSIVNASASTGTTNAAAYFAQTSATNPAVNIQNNIFSHTGGGNAVYITNLNFIYSDYNTYYTASAPLFRTTAALTYATLPVWVNFSYWDVNSISYQPKFVDNISLRPDLANPDVWAIHGRGTQLPGNDYDFDNNPRPTTFTTGVPDMGAYEFLPTSLPTLLTATPATPAPGTTQTFMYGTDTVARITYDATAPVPASINLRRYSGVLPTGLATGQQSMYFYTDIDVPAQGAYKYKVQQYYIDPWRGFIPTEAQVQLGKTNAANAWVVQPNATTDVFMNIMADTGQVYIDRFTGLTGTPPNTQTTYTTVIDSSNRGTRFWVPYGHHYSFSTNGQDMLLYLSAQDSANVTVRINGTNWVRTYAIPANTVRVSDIIPKYGLIDARIDNEGLYEHGISIVSDIPIVAYAHIYDGATSGASLLLPVGVYGYDYQSLNSAQYYPTGGAGSYSWMNVMTDRDSALVEITPAVTTRGGRPAGVPFTVTLMRGQVYSIMGTINGAQGTDLSGTKIRSIANSSGNCYPIAVFSGSSRTSICNTTNGDNLIQQVFPSQAWGRKYLTFSTANSTSNTLYNSNIFRVMVKDPTTVVMKNGVALNPATLVVPGNYYEFNTTQGTGTNGAIYVEADKPVMMAQYMVSTGANSCPGVTATGNGDPEMIYISPIEQGIKQATFYNTTESAITSNYVNIVIPTTGLASLRVDGTVSTFTEVFAHPFLTGYSCVRHNLPAAAGQHRVTSDSAFTAITYGLGSVESYGYNAGTLVKNLNAVAAIANTLGSGATSDYTCVGAPFRFSVLISAKPTQLTWKFSAVPQLNPNVDSIQVNPRPVDSTLINNRWYYRYVVQANFTFSAVGTYNIPIIITDPLNIEGCNNSVEITLPVRVIPAPTIDFAAAAVCLGNQTVFTGTGTTANSVPISSYSWTFGDNTSGTGQNTTHTYATAGTFNVNFSLVSSDGCFAAVTKPVVVNPIPSVAVAVDSLVVCGASPATFTVQNPVTGVTYRWYNVPTGGTALATGTSYTIPSVVGTTVLYVEPTSAAGCVGARVRVVATLLPDLIAPVVTVDSIGVDRIRFRWTAVPGAISYEVSTNAGSTWSTPSSGAAGLTHTITGLQPLSDVTLRVRAIGSAPCQQSVSVDVPGKTLPDAIFIPNAFSPNGDGINDILLVYGYTIQSLRFAVFNQWGEKIFESSNQSTGWDGRYKGKLQPSGVYMYVCQLTLRDGSTQVKKGSINLVQ
ncbi:MAG: T9SS type B sorting domain-containing protein, partial [Chitinophagaceae bacterium]